MTGNMDPSANLILDVTRAGRPVERRLQSATITPMQNNPRSHGLWEMTAPPAPATAALRGDIDADVVVVGGGFAGCSAALHLAEGGARVTVLEAVAIGFGAAGRNAGLVNAGMWVMPDAVIETLGPTHGERLLSLLGNAPAQVFDLVKRHGMKCEAEPVGTLHCAVGVKGMAEIAARAAQWQARGAPVRVLDAAEAAAKIGSSHFPGALLDERAGTIQPLAYVRGLATAAIAAGAKIFTGSAATATERRGGRWRVETESGSVTADWIIVATDAYSKGPWMSLRTEQVHMAYFNIATKPLSDNLRHSILPERHGAWDTEMVLSHFRLDQAGRLIVGSIGALRATGTGVHRRWARAHLHRLFPQLGDVEFDAEWYGNIGMTEEHLPRFHTLAPQVIAVAGYNGRGIAPGTVFGRELARVVLGAVSPDQLALPESKPTPARFRRIKEASYEVGSQLAHIASAL